MRLDAHFGTLPLGAFEHYGDRRIRLHGGGGGIPFVDDILDAGGDLIDGAVNTVSDLASDVGEGISDAYMQVRDPLEAAAVVAGNYFLPGSGLVTSQLVSDKAKESLNSDLGRVAMIGSGIAGGVDGNFSNYGSSESNPTYDYGESNPTHDYGEPNPTYDYGEPPVEVPSTPDLAETPTVPEMPDEVPSGPDLSEPPPEAPTVPAPMPQPSGLEKLAELAAANPILTAGGIATLAGGAAATQTPATPASTPQTYKINPFDFQRNYNTPADVLTKDYSRGQNTGERNWVTDTLTALPQQTVPAKARGGSITSNEAYMHPQYIAQQLAAQGRGGDDTLVHMNRNEVAGLQSLAQAHGKSLHINPRTGMPEAFNLGQELGNATKGVGAPILGAGISYLSGGAIDPMTAAAMVGGTQAVVSGNLGQGLMAGLGAYGGASLMGGLSSMGQSALGAEAYNTANVAGATPESLQSAVQDRMSSATPFESLKAGAGAAVQNPQGALASLGNGDLWKGAGVLGAAASPILADMMVKTTTGAPTNQNPAMIRPYTFQHNAVAPQNMVQPSYQQGQSTAERRWFDDNLTPHTPYLASQANAKYADGGFVPGMASGGLGSLGGYSDGGQLLKGPGDGVSDSIPATIGHGQQPARLADGEFVVPARIVSELGNGSTDAGAKQLYKMMDRIQEARRKTTGKHQVAANTRAANKLPA